MKTEEVVKILEDNKITNVGDTTPYTSDIIHDKLRTYIDLLNTMEDMKDRYMWEFEVPGCQSQTWLIPHFTYEDTIYFTADSAALISKGMVCLLADVFSNSTRKDIFEFDEKELKGLNLDALLTAGRRNGVFSMLKTIKGYGKHLTL